MYTGKLIFAQVMDFMPLPVFRRCVAKYQGNLKVRKFTCLDQFFCMAFAQITYRESLRDIEVCLRSQSKKLYHMGIRGMVCRSTLADANENRDWRIYAELAQTLIATARTLHSTESFVEDLDETVYALDSTTIDLCLSMFPWATFRKRKGAIKLHTLLDLRGNIPTFIYISDGKLHDVNALDLIPLEPGAFYVMDRGYVDFERLYIITQATAFFVTRAKSNFKCRRLYSHQVDRETGLICDQTIVLTGPVSKKDYPEKLRRIRQDAGFFDQQFRSAGFDDSSTVSQPMAGRAVFQMDQAESQDQNLLRHIRKRRQNSNLDSDLGICPRCHHEKTAPPSRESLHNFTDFERHGFRKNVNFSVNYGTRLQNRRTAWV
jgi:hypothetical protein